MSQEEVRMGQEGVKQGQEGGPNWSERGQNGSGRGQTGPGRGQDGSRRGQNGSRRGQNGSGRGQKCFRNARRNENKEKSSRRGSEKTNITRCKDCDRVIDDKYEALTFNLSQTCLNKVPKQYPLLANMIIEIEI